VVAVIDAEEGARMPETVLALEGAFLFTELLVHGPPSGTHTDRVTGLARQQERQRIDCP
jgi:hypothetical protein